jgi:YD repeat-containing protein
MKGIAMNKPEGKLTLAVAKPFLLAILVCIPLSATLCRAQCWSENRTGPYPSMTMSPAVWTAGQSYVVTLSDPNPSDGFFYQDGGSPLGLTCNAFVGPATQFDEFGPINWTQDPNVTVSNVTYISSTQISFTVALGPNTNTGDYWVLVSFGNWLYLSPSISASATNLGPCDKDCKALAGAPINVTTGNVWVQQRDYSVPGLGGGLGLVRTWNSLFGGTASPVYTGMFGLYWKSTYEEMLTGPDSNGYLTYWRGDGSSWSFYYNSTLNSYTLASPPNVRGQLVQNPATGAFTITLADGTQRTFNSQNQLAAIIDRNGNQTTLAYDSSSRLTSVTSPGGGPLSFTYGDSNNAARATTVQDAVGTVATYTYDNISRLTQVSYPDGSALNFTYDPNSLMLLSVTDSQGKLIEAHTYDSQNRGLTSTRANGVDSVSLSY